MRNLNRCATPVLLCSLLGFAVGCSDAGDAGASSGGDQNASAGGSTSLGGSANGVGAAGDLAAGTGGATANGGGGAAGTGGANANGGGGGTGGAKANGGGAGGAGGGGGAGGMIDLPPATGALGKWENVSPPNWTSFVDPPGAFGMGNIVVDPARPMDMYVGGYGSIWKSTDYGLKWTKIDCQPNPASLALGHVLAIAGTSPATLWMATGIGDKKLYKSTDAGLTFRLTGTIPIHTEALYSIIVDPTNSQHLLTGFHEEDRLAESNDGGETWNFVSGSPGWPSGGKSWFPFFVDMQDGATPMKTWFAMAQAGSPAMTSDGGAHWTTIASIAGLEHAHGGANLYQNGKTLFVAGIYGPNGGAGVYRSTDLGKTWSNVSSGNEAMVWGTPKNLYTMWGWACSDCTGAAYKTAPQPGTTWSNGDNTVPWGPNSVAVTSDGTHSLFVGAMWHAGLWRYVEP